MMHSSSSTPSSFSMILSNPYDHHENYHYDHYYHQDHRDTYSFSNPGVDCTLSLGTPSTRLSPDDGSDNTTTTTKRSSHRTRNDKPQSSDSSSSRVSNFCWDLFQPKHHSTNQQTTSYKHNNRVPNNNNNYNNNSSNDRLLDRRCANCDTTSTPLWRNGPRGPKSLCNACGIRFKKEERRATAAAANPTASIDQSSRVYGQHYNNMNKYLNDNNNNNNNWNNFQQYSHYSQPQKNNFNNDEFRFIDNDVDTADTGISFLSWRLNVTDRPSLVHDFTR